MLSLLFKAALGAAAVLIIALLSRSKVFFIAGLVPLFPSFALIAHVLVGSERGSDALRTTAIFGLWALIPYAIYLLVVLHLSTRAPLWLTLSAATLAWCLAAAVLLVAWLRWHG